MTTLYEHAKAFARALRKGQTPAEAILWSKLRNRQLQGKKFLRQHPVFYDSDEKEAFYIADFYCHGHRLILEVNGAIHQYHLKDDAIRTETVELKGYRVIRCRNEDVERNLEGVLEAIEAALNKYPSPFSWQEKGAGGMSSDLSR